MWLRPDQQKVHNMLTEAIMMLCRNGLDYSQEFSVEGLLGITLDRKEVFLVNIKEVVNSANQSSQQSCFGGTSNKQHPVASNDPTSEHSQVRSAYGEFEACLRASRNSPDDPATTGYQQVDGRQFGQRNDPNEPSPVGQQGQEQEGIVTCPLTPMLHPFKSPFRRQRGRRKFFGQGPEGRGMGRRFGFRHQRMMHAIMEAQKHIATPSHMTTFGMPFVKRQHIEDEQLTQAPSTSGVPTSEPEKTSSKMSDSTRDSNQTELEPKVKVEPANSVFPVDMDRDLTIDDSTSLRFGADHGFDEFAGSSPSSRGDRLWPYQEDSLQQPHTPSSVDTADTMTESFEDAAGPSIDKSIISRVKSAILKEEGSFVTTRMLCRRYSAYFKSHIVADAMRAITVSMDDPQHIGIFRSMKERSKVFYKCPPNNINPEVLKQFNMTLKNYAELYFRMPSPKGMQSPRWEAFVQYVSENSPYGPMSAADFTKSQVDTPEEAEPGNSMDEFELQHLIAHSDGCFISSRILCRRLTKQYKVVNVIRAMKAMSRPRSDRHYIGQFVKASERIKVFFKAPPRLVGADALALYGVTIEQYKQMYYASPRPWDGSVSNWDSYMENVSARYPYPFEDFPLGSCDVSPDVADRIQSMIGSGTSAALTGQMAASYASRGESNKLYAAEVSSTATLDKLRSMLSGGKSSAFPVPKTLQETTEQNVSEHEDANQEPESSDQKYGSK